MSESILISTKKILGIAADYTFFDTDIITHINSVFSTLNQLGIGPVDGFMIMDETEEWDEFLIDDPRKNSVRSYMYLRVRLLFDPPATSYLISSMKEQVTELEWRLNVVRETDLYPFVPVVPIDPDEPTVLVAVKGEVVDDDYSTPPRKRF
jgi:hypothetical protein